MYHFKGYTSVKFLFTSSEKNGTLPRQLFFPLSVDPTFISKTRLFKCKVLPPKNDFFFQIKKKMIFCFYVSAQNIDCGYSLEPLRRGGSNEYPQSMSLSRNKKINVYPCKPQFYYIKVGFKGVKII